MPTMNRLASEKKIKLKDISRYLHRLWEGYAHYNPSYHNGIHGVDVCQMTNVLLYDGGIASIMKVDCLDEFAALIAAVSHDFKHDGFNNGYHARINSDRA